MNFSEKNYRTGTIPPLDVLLNIGCNTFAVNVNHSKIKGTLLYRYAKPSEALSHLEFLEKHLRFDVKEGCPTDYWLNAYPETKQFQAIEIFRPLDAFKQPMDQKEIPEGFWVVDCFEEGSKNSRRGTKEVFRKK